MPATGSTDARDRMAQRRQANVMLSRGAACLYWMSRHLERAENIARLLDVNLQLLLDFGATDDEALKEHWLPILRAAGEDDLFFRLYERADSQSVTEFVTIRPDNPNSVCSCFASARENARQVRDQISFEMWEVLNEAWLFLRDAGPATLEAEGASVFCERIKRWSHLFQGLTDSTFSRNEGYEFIQFGKYLERADKTARIMDVKYHILLPRGATDVGGAVDTAQWQAVLRSVSALEAYRRFYVAEILPGKVAEFLLFAETFPRSIRYCAEQVAAYTRRISGSAGAKGIGAGDERLGRFVSGLAGAAIDDVFRAGLHEYLEAILEELAATGEHVYESYMYHPPVDMEAEIRFHQQQEQQQQ